MQKITVDAARAAMGEFGWDGRGYDAMWAGRGPLTWREIADGGMSGWGIVRIACRLLPEPTLKRWIARVARRAEQAHEARRGADKEVVAKLVEWGKRAVGDMARSRGANAAAWAGDVTKAAALATNGAELRELVSSPAAEAAKRAEYQLQVDDLLAVLDEDCEGEGDAKNNG